MELKAINPVRHFCATVALSILALCTAACSTNSGTLGGTAFPPAGSARSGSGSSNYISHVVVIVQENRSFNDLFATFPGADGTTQGEMETTSGPVPVTLTEVPLKERCDFAHGYQGFLKNYDGGKMDGFALPPYTCNDDPTAPYQYVDPQDIAPYWTMAEQYVLGEHTFQTQGSGSFTAHQDLIAGGTCLTDCSSPSTSKSKSLIDLPTHIPWGCDAPHHTKTSTLKWTGRMLRLNQRTGPFPCLSYATLRDLLDANSVSWKYYSPPVFGGEGQLWNAFDAIRAVRYDTNEWGTNVTSSNTQIFTDITSAALPAVSWVIPDREESDHPGPGDDTGPSWVASLVNAIGNSSYWDSTAIVIVWDDWGGFYDNMAPPFFDHWGGLGFRVPMIVISPYAKEAIPSQPGYISPTQYEFGSILKFIEQTFNLGSLNTTDARANSIVDCFDFTQPARTFQQIPSSYSKSYFIHKRPSTLPVDTE